MSLARARNWTAPPGDKHTNHEITMPPTLCEITGQCSTSLAHESGALFLFSAGGQLAFTGKQNQLN